jgi:hypothetical protein
VRVSSVSQSLVVFEPEKMNSESREMAGQRVGRAFRQAVSTISRFFQRRYFFASRNYIDRRFDLRLFRSRPSLAGAEPIVRPLDCEACDSHHYENEEEEDEGVSEVRRQFLPSSLCKLLREGKLQLSFPIPPFTPTEEGDSSLARGSIAVPLSAPAGQHPLPPQNIFSRQVVHSISPPPSMVWRRPREEESGDHCAARPRPRGRRANGEEENLVVL